MRKRQLKKNFKKDRARRLAKLIGTKTQDEALFCSLPLPPIRYSVPDAGDLAWGSLNGFLAKLLEEETN